MGSTDELSLSEFTGWTSPESVIASVTRKLVQAVNASLESHRYEMRLEVRDIKDFESLTESDRHRLVKQIGEGLAKRGWRVVKCLYDGGESAYWDRLRISVRPRDERISLPSPRDLWPGSVDIAEDAEQDLLLAIYEKLLERKVRFTIPLPSTYLALPASRTDYVARKIEKRLEEDWSVALFEISEMDQQLCVHLEVKKEEAEHQAL
jgi:hypothetical protein